MKKQTDVAIKAHIIPGASYLLLLVAGTVMAFFGPQAPTKVLPRTLTFAERMARDTRQPEVLRELFEGYAGVEPISDAQSRRTVQVAQHDH